MESQNNVRQATFTRPYILAIARRVLSAHFASREDHRYSEFDDAEQEPVTVPADPELPALTRLRVSLLPLDVRDVVKLSYWDGMSRSEISTALGLPLGTVASRLRRALGILGQEDAGDE